MKYQVGDRVLVAHTVLGVQGAAVYVGMKGPWVEASDIHGPAPAPEVDWSTVPMGARVRVRASPKYDWHDGRLIQWSRKGPPSFHVLSDDGLTNWWSECELVEGGGE